MSDMSLWTLIQKYCDDTGAKEAAVMRRAGLNKGAFAAWRQRGIPSLPTRRDVLGLAAALHTDYETVLTAILHDTKYLPESAALSEQERIDAINSNTLESVDQEAKELLDQILAEVDGDMAEARNVIQSLRFEDRVRWAVADSAEIILDELVVDELEQRRNQKASEPDDSMDIAAIDADKGDELAGESEQRDL